MFHRFNNNIQSNLFRTLDPYNRHYQIHLLNPNINYIRAENCVYCKRERSNRYSNRIDQRNLNNLDRFQDQFRYYNYSPPPSTRLTQEQEIRIQAVRSYFRQNREYRFPNQEIINYEDLEPVPIPLNLEQLNRASTLTTYKLIDEVENSEQLCSICQDQFQLGDIIRNFKLPCGHKYHQGCIDKWLEKKHQCPNCRCDLRTLR